MIEIRPSITKGQVGPVVLLDRRLGGGGVATAWVASTAGRVWHLLL
jgi:hypothetical protein